jgi:hypothetical protein
MSAIFLLVNLFFAIQLWKKTDEFDAYSGSWYFFIFASAINAVAVMLYFSPLI